MTRSAKGTVLIAIALFCSGCARVDRADLNSLTVQSISVKKPTAEEWGALATAAGLASEAIRFDIKIEANIQSLANQGQYSVQAVAWLCNNNTFDASQKLETLPQIFDAQGDVGWGLKSKPANSNQETNQYHFYLFTSGLLGDGNNLKVRYDLHQMNAKICFRLIAGNMEGETFYTNTVIVNPAAISSALRSKN